MGTPLTTLSPNDQIYAYALAARYRSPWIYDPSLAFLKDADAWTTLLNDTDVRSIRQRRNQSLVRQWRVIPSPHGTSKSVGPSVGDNSKRLAAICNEALSNVTQFEMARYLLADAFYIGRKYGEIEYEEIYASLDGTPPMLWYLPVKIRDVDRRRFRWVPEWSTKAESKKTGIHLELFDTNSMSWVALSTDQRRRYVEYIWEDTEDRIGHGLGAFEALFFTHYFKTGAITKLMQGIDRYANGFLIGKLDSTRAASTDLSNSELTTKMKELLQKIRSEHVAVLGDGDSIELLETTGTGMQIALDLVRYFNESAERLCNGSVRPAGHSVDGTGSKAAADTESDTSEAFYQFPREDLDSVLDRDLLGSFLYFNEGNFQALGLADAKRPKFTSAQIRRQDPLARIEVLNQSKVPILRSEYYEAIEATPPGPDDDVVEPSADPAMMNAEMDPLTGFPKTSDDQRDHEMKQTKMKTMVKR